MRYYDGETPCPGCGRPGTERTRLKKDSLCYECEDMLKLGRQARADNARKEYINVTLHFNSCRNPRGCDSFHRFLHALDNPSAIAQRWKQYLPKFGNNEATYKIPTYIAEAVGDLLKELNAEYEEIMSERNSIPKQVEEKLNEERNRIYNDGVAYGRNLLKQLNRGEIGLADFEALQKKY